MYLVAVTMQDGQKHVVDCDGRDIRRWEIENKESFLNQEFSYIMLTDLARLAMTRQGLTSLTKAEFDDQCVDVRDQGSTEADPT